MTGFIYKITNMVNDKCYIGKTRNTIEERWNAHIRRSRDLQYTYPLYLAIRKHGIENFNIETIEEVSLDDINIRERYYIELHDSYYNGYNATKGGDGDIFDTKDEGEILSLYLSGFTQFEIGKLYDVSSTTIGRILNKHDVERYQRSFIDEDEFIELYLKNVKLRVMAEHFNVDIVTIRRLRNKLNLPKRVTHKEPGKIVKINEFKSDYLNGMSLKELSEKYHVDVKTVGNVRNKLNLPKRKK